MGKIAVHLHLYYENMLEYFFDKISNLSEYPYDLYVTLVNDNEKIKSRILSFNAKAIIMVFSENKGYDVGPFIEVINSINLAEYDYVIKIHTKNNDKSSYTILNGYRIDDRDWSAFLVNALLGSKKIVAENIRYFENNKNCGMLGSDYCLTKNKRDYDKLLVRINEVLRRIGLAQIDELQFVAGTMFMMRSKLLQPLQNKYSIEDFAVSEVDVKEGELAHVFERAFGAIVQSQGSSLLGIKTDPYFVLKSYISQIKRFFFQSKKTKNGYIVKVLKVPVYVKKNKKQETNV